MCLKVIILMSSLNNENYKQLLGKIYKNTFTVIKIDDLSRK